MEQLQKLPQCLKRKLVFGDREQINALQELERLANEAEENERKGLKKYHIYAEVEGYLEEDVWAESAREAEEEFESKISIYDLYDFGIDITVKATEIKDNKV